ncbi:MAG: adenylosuccinate synthase [Ruminococcus sp.]|nr:adenylosuccinate synthase [Oscillospiraceae bacterium]MDD7344477.1 adenylosuccinate synthase [Ruminococcus sp.]
MVKAIVGANWGDEGKGKITDMFAEKADIVIRFQGGANAGHTIINDKGRFAFHLMPSGVCYDHTTCIIGNGVALDINKFLSELEDVRKAGLNPKLLVSDRVQILMPYHILLDTYEEERLGKNAFGSTKSGIAPFFSDKYAKIGIQLNELFDEETLRAKLKNICTLKNLTLEHVYHKPLLDEEELYNTCMEYKEKIAPYVCDTHAYLQQAIKDGKEILLEGQLGTLKDPDFGIYPMVTSSSTLAGYGAVGAGIPPHMIKEVIAVTKAYSSAVGAGEFISEILDEDEAQELRIHGGDKGEFGATTGRPRRVGWFDCVATRYGIECQGATKVVMTAIDCLSYLDEIKVCTAYEVDGKIINDFPTTAVLKKCKPVFTTLKGWHSNIRGIKNYDELPDEAKAYVEFIEKQLGHKIDMVSNGPEREAIIYR